MSTGQPIAVLDDDDLSRAPAVDAAYARHPFLRTRRFVVVPLVAGGRAMGVAVADNKRSRRPIPAASLEPLSLLCQQLASAVQEARLNAESRTREQEVRKLYEVTSQLASNLDVDWIFDHITSRALDLFGSDAAGIYTYDAARGGLVFRRGANLDDRLTRDLVLRPGEGVGGRAYLDRRPVWTRDRLADPSLRYTPASGALVAECAPRAYLAVPIAIRGEVLGVLVGFFFAPHDFTPREVQLLTTLAGHAAIALDNARLYEETRTQQTRLSQIFDSTSDGFVLVGRQGRIEAANRRAGELLGIDAAGALGRDMSEARPRGDAAGIDAEALAALCAAAVDADREAEGELHLRARQRVVLWAARPTRSASGAAVGVTLTFRDVTREREVSDMKSDFVSFVTHQLRTPLAGIKWMLELAAEDPALPADAASYVEDAREAAQRLIDLVNDLLDISRLERGKLTVEPVPVRLGDLTQSVLDETALILRDKGHVVSVSGGDAVPAVLADVQLLRQVVLNLTSNAIKYTPAGGAIAIAMRPEAGRVTWAITDNGIGIPGASRARLFEKFYRADNAAAVETEGTGLGLYLVRLILEHLGGHIQCESTEGQGSTFTLTLPVAP
jgi:PAS domain S-box-containing protein